MAGRRICAGYYRRYDGKTVYVISTATDADTGKEIVIWTAYPFADVPKYYTSSKKSFCAFVEVNRERKAKYKRLMNMKISEAVIERLEDEGFRGPVRKKQRRQLEEEYDSREYQQSLTYLSYAKDLCENYNFDRSKYRLCVKEKRFAAITRSDFAKLKEDLQFLDNSLKTVCQNTGTTFGSGSWRACLSANTLRPTNSTGAAWTTCKKSFSLPWPGF